MDNLREKLAALQAIAGNPAAQLEKFLSEGRKVVGCMPYFCPEELVYASGMVPFGLTGEEMQASEAKRYWPAFICSVMQTVLELGLRGRYDGLTAVMIPALCDALKGMDGNWRRGVKKIPAIPVVQAQNRKTEAGLEFTASQYRKIRSRLAELAGREVTDAAVAGAVSVYNDRRAAMRGFMAASAARPGLLKPSQRSAVFKSAFFMDVNEHAAAVRELTALIEEQPAAEYRGPKLVTSGIMADNSGLLGILDDCGVAVVDDEVTNESLRYRTDIPVTEDPFKGMALLLGEIEGCSVLYDPGKNRGRMLIDLAKKSGADGVLLVQTKFCDPEEYDYVPLRRMLEEAGIRNLMVEIDLQTTENEQTRTAVEAFCESLR